jgi:hypothetical protein
MYRVIDDILLDLIHLEYRENISLRFSLNQFTRIFQLLIRIPDPLLRMLV